MPRMRRIIEKVCQPRIHTRQSRKRKDFPSVFIRVRRWFHPQSRYSLRQILDRGLTMTHHFRSLTAVLLLVACPGLCAAEVGYYAQPALHGDRLVFVSEGDLWTALIPAAAASGS